MSYTDPLAKRANVIKVTVPSYVDSGLGGNAAGAADQSTSLSIGNKLEYRNFGMFTREASTIKQRRDEKFEEKQQKAALIAATADDPSNILNAKRSRGRKTKLKL